MSVPLAPSHPLVQMRSIAKRFGAVTVLRDVDLDIHGGEVLILAGENGAGKSTLIKILGGVHTSFEGRIEMGGRDVRPRSPLDAARLGIAVIHQELSLVPSLTVADNLFLGHPDWRRGFVRESRRREAARALVDRYGIGLEVTRRIEDLPVAQQQLAEIAKALARQARVLVMDEPTSSLNAPEVQRLFHLIHELKTRGCGIVYITHKMEEIFQLADRIAVLRDGRHIGTARAADLSMAQLLEWMVGRSIDQQYPAHASQPGGERLRLEGFTLAAGRQAARRLVDGVSLAIRAGEIVGLAGLQGSGASELLRGLFGAWGGTTQGRVWIDGRETRIGSPRQAITRGLALLTNDRKATGLVLPLSIIANLTLADLPRLARGGWRRPARERAAAERLAAELAVRASSLDLPVGSLSGGNQQKIALAKWLLTQPRILLLDEPTRGIDVGAKHEIYERMNAWTRQGTAILLITSELPELLALSDRIVVLHRGRITAEFPRAAADPARILSAAMGQTSEPVRDPGAVGSPPDGRAFSPDSETDRSASPS